ncbi:hypothetical protein GR183_19980 [Stappia sp. GBMRC 2046]|uniref:Glycosyltransferase 2-like prokaryotic type domain-containing protein n=1 Tax=Stappia sediminis TaxID=2692190 RepID=A0A7X3LY35_9HYPH|nr:hypothetical protein [Stappia sediminis]MXN67195.1 hypothetical protein [Stappia sediminis]
MNSIQPTDTGSGPWEPGAEAGNQPFRNLSVVVPIGFVYRPAGILRRLRRLIDSRLFDGAELIVSVAVRNRFGDRLFSSLARRISKACRVIFVEESGAEISIARLRHEGARAASRDLLLFYDVDLICSQSVVEKAITYLKGNRNPFVIIPSIYTRKKALSAGVSAGDGPVDQVWKGLLAKRRYDLIYHVAMYTSTILIERSKYFQSGGFDPNFSSHGLEDLEYICRLCIREKVFELSDVEEFLKDGKAVSPLFTEGFRKYLNIITIPVWLEGIFTVHLWHSRPKRTRYFKERKRNYGIFSSNIKEEYYKNLSREEKYQFKREYLESYYESPLAEIEKILNSYGEKLANQGVLFLDNPADLYRNRIERFVIDVLRRLDKKVSD